MKNYLSLTLALLIYAAAASEATAQPIAITPVSGGLIDPITSEPVNINTLPGHQADPHVSGNLVSYTDFSLTAGSIVYYNFLTGGTTPIPNAANGSIDTLASTDGTRIAFSSQLGAPLRAGIMVFDTTTFSQTEIDPQPGSLRYGTAIAGGRVAFVEAANSAGGDIFVHDLATGITTNLSSVLGAKTNRNPRIAPDGNTVVWHSCNLSFAECGVYAAVWETTVICPFFPCPPRWQLYTVEDTPPYSALHSDTDGTWFVYQSTRPGVAEMDIYFKPMFDDGIGERRLAIPGQQYWPRIDQGVIAFLSRIQSATSPSDLFVYVIATNRLYQITDTPSVDESLSDVTVLPNGDIRVVWAANDEGLANNIYAVTFTPHRVLAIDSVSAGEGDGGTTPYAFTVSLLPERVGTVSVDFATADGTATAADGDYTPTGGTLTFGIGQPSKTITVLVNGDTRQEADENFAVVFSNLLGAGVIISPSHGAGTGTIINDDAALPVLSIANLSIAEGNGGVTPFTFTVSLSAPSAQTVTVNYTTVDGTATIADGDYTAVSGNLTFTPNTQTSQDIKVLVNGDTKSEPDETFTVKLSGASNATISPTQGIATGTIQNDDDAAPVVQSIVRLDPNPTGANSVSWRVTFSETVTGVAVGDFEPSVAGLTGAKITGMSGANSIYIVTAATGTGSGTLALRVRDNDTIKDLADNPLGGTGIGNGSITGGAYTIDKTPPDTTITATPANPSNTSGPAFQFGSSELVSSFECKLDAGAFAACSSPQTYTGVPDGNHTFQVRAIDAVGNVDPSPASYNWTIDTVPPDTAITAGPSGIGSLTVDTVSFQFVSNEANNTFECSLDGAAFAACVSGITYTDLASGAHSFQVRAKDAAGNLDPTPASRTWRIVANNPGRCRSPWNLRCNP